MVVTVSTVKWYIKTCGTGCPAKSTSCAPTSIICIHICILCITVCWLKGCKVRCMSVAASQMKGHKQQKLCTNIHIKLWLYAKALMLNADKRSHSVYGWLEPVSRWRHATSLYYIQNSCILFFMQMSFWIQSEWSKSFSKSMIHAT